MVQEVLISISIIVGISAILTLLARLIKQPPIIAYLIAGVLIGPLFLNVIGNSSESSAIIQTFARLGVALLLFIVGLSLDFKVLKEVGAVSSIAGFSQVIITGLIGFLIAIGIGFSNITAIYIAIAVAFSSTVVVVKILSDKREIDTLHGRIALGILIIQDFLAALALMIIPAVSNGKVVSAIFYKMGLAIVLILLVFLFSSFVLKRIINYVAVGQEGLFLFGIAWALALASTFHYLGFSLEIGALIAGMSLASTKYTMELEGKIKPLRDFFVVIFFVFFGSQLAGAITSKVILSAIIISLFVIIGKPLIVMTILKAFKYKKRTNFLTGISLAQISEFSLILVLLGFHLGHLSQEVMSLVVIVSIITIGISSYTLHHAHNIFGKISHLLGIFDGNKEEERIEKKTYDVVLIGYHRMGYKIMEALKQKKLSVLVVDYNPKVIISLTKAGIDCAYGDAGDESLLGELNLDKCKLIISTIPYKETNLALAKFISKEKIKATLLATSEQSYQALELYGEGVDYVILPHHLGGDYAAEMIREFSLNKEKYKELGKEQERKIKKGKEESTYK